MNLLIDFNSSNISLICNMIFLGIIILCLISCFTGLKKGLVKSTLKLVVWIILILVVYLNNMNVAKAVYDFDITPISNLFGVVSISINDKTISVSQSIGNIVGDLLKAYELTSSTEAVNALALSVISFITLIIDMILCLIVSPIMTFILYICLVRPIFKNSMKKHKLRLGGFFVNGIKTVLVSAAFLTPLFSTAEVLLRNYNDALNEDYQYDKEKSNQYWNIIYPIMDGYNDSFLHSFFSLITGQGRMNGYYTARVKGTNTPVNFVDLLGDAFSVACSTLSVAEDVSQGALISAALTDQTLELLTTKLLNNVFLVNEVLPIITSIALNMVEDNTFLSKDAALKLSEEIKYLDFGKDLSSYVELIRILNKEGYISETVGNFIKNNSFDYEFSSVNKTSLKQGLAKFNELQNQIKEDETKKTLIEVVLPPVLVSLVNNAKNTSSKDEVKKAQGESNNVMSKFLDILPTTEEEYRSIDIIDMLDTFVDVIFNFNDLYVQAKVLNGKDDNNLKVSEFQSIDVGAMLDVFFNKEIINNESGTLSLFEGNETTKGLLDIPFVVDNINSLFETSLSLIEKNEIITEEVIEEINAKINEMESTKDTWAKEFGYLFKFVSELFNNNDLPLIMKNEKDGKVTGVVVNASLKVDFNNTKHVDILKSALMQIEDSNLITSIAKPIVKNTLKNQLSNNELISVEDFNFDYFSEGTNLVHEIIKIIDNYAKLQPIMEMKGDNFLDLGITSFQLKELFDVILDCEIINPDEKLIEGTGINNGLRKIIVNLLSSQSMKDIGFNFDESIYDNCSNLQEEFYKIADIYGLLVDDNRTLKDLINNKNDVKIDSIKGEDIKDLVDLIAESDFLRPSLGSILEKNIKPTITSMESLKIEENDVDFRIIENTATSVSDEIAMWQNEGEQLAILINKVNTFTSFDKAKGEDVEVLINALVDSRIFGTHIGRILNNNKNDLVKVDSINTNYIDFETIDKLTQDELERKNLWKQDIHNLGLFIDALKELKNENGDFEFASLAKDKTNKEKIENLFNPLVDVYFLSENYNFDNDEYNYDRLGLMIFDLIKDSLKDYVFEERVIQKDLSFAINDEYYCNLLNENINNEDRKTRWNKELDKFYDVIFAIGDLQNEENVVVVNLSNPDSIQNIKNVLLGTTDIKGMNDVVFLRTILSNIFEKSINEQFNNNNDIKSIIDIENTYINASSFNKELNFKSNSFGTYITKRQNNAMYNEDYDLALSKRDIEITSRGYEINRLMNIFNDVFDNIDVFKGESIKIQDIKPIFKGLMLNLHDSIIFNDINNKDAKLTAFENITLTSMNKSSITDVSYIEEINKGNAEIYMKEKISDLSLNDETILKRTWWEEIEDLDKLLNNENLTDELLNSLKYVEDLTNKDSKTLKSILEDLNSTYLTHDTVAYYTKTLMSNTAVNTCIIDHEDENTKLRYYLDEGLSLDEFDEKVAIWDHEIVNLMSIRDSLIYGEENDKHFYDLNNINFASDEDRPSLEVVLPLLEESKIIEPGFNDILYTVFERANLSDYISSIAESNLYSDYANLYENDINSIKKQKRDTIKYLNDNRINDFAIEGKFIDEGLKYISDNKSLNMSGDKTEEEILNITNLFTLSYKYNGENYQYATEENNFDPEELLEINETSISDMVNKDKYVRGYLLSELMLNLFDKQIKETINTSITYFEDCRYSYTYTCFNDYEKNALSSLLSLRGKFSSLEFTPSTDVEVIKKPLYDILSDHSNFIKLGPGKTLEAPKLDESNEYLFNGYNSYIASQIIQSGYIEDAFKASPLGVYLTRLPNSSDIFTLGEGPIQYEATTLWFNKVQELGH